MTTRERASLWIRLKSFKMKGSRYFVHKLLFPLHQLAHPVLFRRRLLLFGFFRWGFLLTTVQLRDTQERIAQDGEGYLFHNRTSSRSKTKLRRSLPDFYAVSMPECTGQPRTVLNNLHFNLCILFLDCLAPALTGDDRRRGPKPHNREPGPLTQSSSILYEPATGLWEMVSYCPTRPHRSWWRSWCWGRSETQRAAGTGGCHERSVAA